MTDDKTSGGRRVISQEQADAVNAKAGTAAYAAAPRKTLDRFGMPINRREALAYATAGALALLTLGGAVTLTSPNSSDQMIGLLDPNGEAIPGGFAYPRIKEGEFGGTFTVDRKVESYTLDEPPELNSAGKFFIVKTAAPPAGGELDPAQQGIIAIYQVCTHLGCLIPFQPAENRFICPCHGSTFERNSQWVRGPAPRNLDQFPVEIGPDGTIVVNTGKKQTGTAH
jgi:cytochrome b6-f complex iron-sulfur subunit